MRPSRRLLPAVLMPTLITVALLIVSRSADAQTYEVVHRFLGNLGHPYAPLLQTLDGSFYGTEFDGGVHGMGRVFALHPDGAGGYTSEILHDFSGTSGDGANPYAGLVLALDGRLFGTTYFGGANGYGTVFAVDPATNAYAVLHDFNTGSGNGANPYSGLLQATDGNLYGTTVSGGANGYGTIFKIDPSGSSFTVVHDFDAISGANPYAGLIQAADGQLYGTTESTTVDSQNRNGSGTVYRIDPASSAFAIVHAFVSESGEGVGPNATLVEASDGKLYGTTEGGPRDSGTAFRVDPSTNGFQVLHTFNSARAAARSFRRQTGSSTARPRVGAPTAAARRTDSTLRAALSA